MTSKRPASGSVCSHALRYLGDATGTPHLSGIPSRDLSDADVHRLASLHGLTHDDLVASGLFTAARPLPAANSSADDSEKGDR